MNAEIVAETEEWHLFAAVSFEMFPYEAAEP
jgi:hypothetical protein